MFYPAHLTHSLLCSSHIYLLLIPVLMFYRPCNIHALFLDLLDQKKNLIPPCCDLSIFLLLIIEHFSFLKLLGKVFCFFLTFVCIVFLVEMISNCNVIGMYATLSKCIGNFYSIFVVRVLCCPLSSIKVNNCWDSLPLSCDSFLIVNSCSLRVIYL